MIHLSNAMTKQALSHSLQISPPTCQRVIAVGCITFLCGLRTEGERSRRRTAALLSELKEPELCLAREAAVLGANAGSGGRRFWPPSVSTRIWRTRFTPQALHKVLGPARAGQARLSREHVTKWS